MPAYPIVIEFFEKGIGEPMTTGNGRELLRVVFQEEPAFIAGFGSTLLARAQWAEEIALRARGPFAGTWHVRPDHPQRAGVGQWVRDVRAPPLPTHFPHRLRTRRRRQYAGRSSIPLHLLFSGIIRAQGLVTEGSKSGEFRSLVGPALYPRGCCGDEAGVLFFLDLVKDPDSLLVSQFYRLIQVALRCVHVLGYALAVGVHYA